MSTKGPYVVRKSPYLRSQQFLLNKVTRNDKAYSQTFKSIGSIGSATQSNEGNLKKTTSIFSAWGQTPTAKTKGYGGASHIKRVKEL
jgi:hypothetical protein